MFRFNPRLVDLIIVGIIFWVIQLLFILPLLADIFVGDKSSQISWQQLSSLVNKCFTVFPDKLLTYSVVIFLAGLLVIFILTGIFVDCLMLTSNNYKKLQRLLKIHDAWFKKLPQKDLLILQNDLDLLDVCKGSPIRKNLASSRIENYMLLSVLQYGNAALAHYILNMFQKVQLISSIIMCCLLLLIELAFMSFLIGLIDGHTQHWRPILNDFNAFPGMFLLGVTCPP